MKDENYIIRAMNRSEIDFAIELAANEGWNPGLYDADCFYNTDPNGFFIGLLNDEPIGCISAVSYQKQFGFLGFYIIKPEYRGKGYGLKLWNTAVDYLTNIPSSGLDGVVEQQSNYMKSGFKLAYRNIRFEGIGNNKKIKDGLVPIKEIPFDLINKYDNNFFPVDRNEFLKCWINQPESLCLAEYDEKNINGYGVIRTCGKGFKIGPLFAEDEIIAEKIFNSLCSFAGENNHVYLDIPEVNPLAAKLVEKYKMNKVFETARMYKGKKPELPLRKIFGVTTFELG